MRISPAVLGSIAIIAAGFGSAVTANEADRPVNPSSLVAGATASSAQGDDIVPAADEGVDVSRSFDRETLARQIAQQTKQRDLALEQSDRDVAARASDLEQAEAERKKAEEERRNQWVLPVTGYTLTARFGAQSGRWSSGSHTGLDFAGASGSKVVAVAAGTVKSAGYSGAYGNRTVITLEDGTEVWYCHQSRIVVNAGDQVMPGDLTGYTGSTGNVTGPHLHLEIRPGGGGPVDPEPVLRSHGVSP